MSCGCNLKGNVSMNPLPKRNTYSGTKDNSEKLLCE